MKIQLNIVIMYLVTLGILLSSCQKEEISTDGDLKNTEQVFEDLNCEQFNKVMGNLSYFDNPLAIDIPQKVGELIQEENQLDGVICEVQGMKFHPEHFELFNLNRLSNMTPGMIFEGNSILNGGYTPVVTNRNPITLFINIPKLDGYGVSTIVEDPNPASITEEINGLLGEVVGNTTTPAIVDFDMKEVFSAEHIKSAIGVNAKGWGAKINAGFDFNNSRIKSRFILRFKQIYYTISMNPVKSPCDFFKELPNPSVFNGQLPVYVSSVSYGRMVYFMLESEEEKDSVKKAFEAGFKKWGVNLSVNLSKEEESVIKNTNKKAIIIGGDGDDAVLAIDGIEGIVNYIKKGGNFSEKSLGVPLSYSLNYLDNSAANVVMVSDYKVRNCKPMSSEVIIRHNDPLLDSIYPLSYKSTGNDRQFGDDCPYTEVKVWLSLSPDKRKLYLNTNGYVVEPDERPGDGHFTEGKIHDRKLIYCVPEGNFIDEILSDKSTEISYTDSDDGLDKFFMGEKELIREFIFRGCTSNSDLPYLGQEDEPDFDYKEYAFIDAQFNDIIFKVKSL